MNATEIAELVNENIAVWRALHRAEQAADEAQQAANEAHEKAVRAVDEAYKTCGELATAVTLHQEKLINTLATAARQEEQP